MIFFISKDGTIAKSMPSPVYQGSDKANTLYIVAPFIDSTVTVAFKLPNGVWTERLPTEEAQERILDDEFGVWEYALPAKVTRMSGVVTAQFFFYANGSIISTSSTSFSIGRGVPKVLPDEPEDDVYDTILEVLSELRKSLNSGTYTARAIYEWRNDDSVKYDEGDVTFIHVGEHGSFVRSKVDGNTDCPYAEDGTLNENWEEIVNFDCITQEYWGELKKLVEEAEKQAVRAENAVTNLEDLAGKSIDFVPILPALEDALPGKLYAVVADSDSNLFDLYSLQMDESGTTSWRHLGSENILANGITLYTFTLVSGGAWKDSSQTVVIPNFEPSFNVELYPNDSSAAEYIRCGVSAVLSDVGKITFTCEIVPEINITVCVKMAVQFELPSVARYYTRVQTDQFIDGVEDKIKEIEKLIPSQATPSNPLVDRTFVNSSIEQMAAKRVTYNAAGDGFPTRATLLSATTFYHGGVVYTPDEHDYALVIADEDAPGPFTNGQTRFEFDGRKWTYSYGINDRPFTAAERAALESGVSSELVEKFPAVEQKANAAYSPDNPPPASGEGSSIYIARFTIPTSKWSSSKQAVLTSAVQEKIAKVTRESLLDVRPADSLVEGSSANFIKCGIAGHTQADGSVTLKCDSVPSVSVGIEIIVYN